MWSCVEDMMDVTGAVSSGDFVRSALAKQTMIQDDDARFENKRIKEEKIDDEVKRMPLSVGKLLANVMTAIGPKGVSFAKYSVDYHTLRNYVYVHRNFKSNKQNAARHIPSYAKQIVEEYNGDGWIDALIEREN